jgi:hypothetical protein
LKKILISKILKVNFLLKFFFDIVYILPSNDIKNKKIKKKIVYLPPDFINLRENFLSENIAAKYSEKILNEYIGEVPNFFPNEDNYNFLYWDLRKYLSTEITKYLKCEYFADKVLKEKQIKDAKIFINLENIDYTVLQLLKKNNIIKYSIPSLLSFKYFLRSFLRLTFTYFYIGLLPEIKFFFCKNLLKKKSTFKVGYNLFFRQNFDEWHGSPDFFLKNKNFDKNEVIYVANSRIQMSKKGLKTHNEWVDELKKKHNIINLNSISKSISKKKYLGSIYPEAKRLRNFFFKNFKILNLININAANILSLNTNWKIFYELFSIKHFFSSMIYGENITNFIQSNQSISSNFIYFSTTGDLLDERKFNNHTEWLQYSYHRYDNFFGTKLSYEQFITYENIFKNFCETGNFASNKILNSNKKEILEKLKIPTGKKLISFFDDTWALGGTQSFSSYEKFLDSIIRISKENQDFFYLFKPKKDFNYFLKMSNNKIFDKIQEIINLDNIIFFDSSFVDKNKIDAHDLIAASEICIFSPMSSLSYDALCSKKKTIVFDPDKIYNNEKYILTMSELLYTQDYYQLLNTLKYWLKNENDYMINVLNEKYLKPYVDKYCDKNSVKRFINYIDTK